MLRKIGSPSVSVRDTMSWNVVFARLSDDTMTHAVEICCMIGYSTVVMAVSGCTCCASSTMHSCGLWPRRVCERAGAQAQCDLRVYAVVHVKPAQRRPCPGPCYGARADRDGTRMDYLQERHTHNQNLYRRLRALSALAAVPSACRSGDARKPTWAQICSPARWCGCTSCGQ